MRVLDVDNFLSFLANAVLFGPWPGLDLAGCFFGESGLLSVLLGKSGHFSALFWR